MLAKRVIACLDVYGGRVVKGTNFVDLWDAGDPAELAARYCDEGADEIVFLDIAATVEERQAVYQVVERTARRVFVPLTVGGGLSNLKRAKRLLESGADKVAINSAAIKRPELITEIATELGSQATVVAIDAKREGACYRVYSHGGSTRTDWIAKDWANHAESLGAGEILLTSIDNDGTNSGFDLGLTKSVRNAVHIPLVASGGAGLATHFVDVFREAAADAALAASIFHRQDCSVAEIKLLMAQQLIAVRPK